MSNQLIVSPITLLLALILVLIALAINLKEDLGMTKDLIIGVVRAVIQLTVVGFVLTYIIKADTVWLTLAMIAVIILTPLGTLKTRRDNSKCARDEFVGDHHRDWVNAGDAGRGQSHPFCPVTNRPNLRHDRQQRYGGNWFGLSQFEYRIQ